SAVADAATSVDDEDGEVFGKRGILEPIVHDDDARPLGARDLRAGGPISCHDRRRDPGKQQRLVADFRSAMPPRLDEHRTARRAAIAARKKKWPLARCEQKATDRERRRRLASAAESRTADDDPRPAGGFSGLPQPCRRRPAVKTADGRKQRR